MTTLGSQIMFNLINSQTLAKTLGVSNNYDATYIRETDSFVLQDQKNLGNNYFLNRFNPYPQQAPFTEKDGRYTVEHVFGQNGKVQSEMKNIQVEVPGSTTPDGQYDSAGILQIKNETNYAQKHTPASTFTEYGTFRIDPSGAKPNGSLGTYFDPASGFEMDIIPTEDGRYALTRGNGEVVYTVGVNENGKVYMEDDLGRLNEVVLGEKANGRMSLCDLDGHGFEFAA